MEVATQWRLNKSLINPDRLLTVCPSCGRYLLSGKCRCNLCGAHLDPAIERQARFVAIDKVEDIRKRMKAVEAGQMLDVQAVVESNEQQESWLTYFFAILAQLYAKLSERKQSYA